MESNLSSIFEFQPSDRSEIDRLLKEKKELTFSYMRTELGPVLLIDKQLVFVAIQTEQLNTTMFFSSHKYLGKTTQRYRLKRICLSDLSSCSPRN